MCELFLTFICIQSSYLLYFFRQTLKGLEYQIENILMFKIWMFILIIMDCQLILFTFLTRILRKYLKFYEINFVN